MAEKNVSTNLLENIRARLDSLNKSERKVAEAILRDPESATRFSIAALAHAADVSEPTVNRFCRNFSASGFPDFKIHLAQSLASGTPYVSQNVKPDDPVSVFADKIVLSTMASLDRARQALDPAALGKAIDYLIQAKQIAFFGMGGSAPVAMDAQHKFFRFNIPVTAYDDTLMQRMVAAAASTGDAIVVISYTGRTREMVDVAESARANGATVIGITAAQLAPVQGLHRGAGSHGPGRHRRLYADDLAHHPPGDHRYPGHRRDPQARLGFPGAPEENQGQPAADAVSGGRKITGR